MKILKLFTRPGCHLCEQLEEELLPLILAGRSSNS